MPLDIQVIRDSFEKAKPIAGEVADKFYEILFEIAPPAEGLFKDVDMDVQKRALMKSLTFAVDNIDQEQKLYDYLFKMGARHFDYGATEDHYPIVGEALLNTFAHFFGADWTAELEDQWVQAYQAISGIMIEGQRSRSPEIGTIKDKAKQVAKSLLIEVLDEEMDDEIIAMVRNRIRNTLMEVLQEESEQLGLDVKAA
jgi:hemoglobin-like flavoprotein